jgi:hypothetical protein
VRKSWDREMSIFVVLSIISGVLCAEAVTGQRQIPEPMQVTGDSASDYHPQWTPNGRSRSFCSAPVGRLTNPPLSLPVPQAKTPMRKLRPLTS